MVASFGIRAKKFFWEKIRAGILYGREIRVGLSFEDNSELMELFYFIISFVNRE